MSVSLFLLDILIGLCSFGELIIKHPFISAGIIAGFVYGTKKILKIKQKKKAKKS